MWNRVYLTSSLETRIARTQVEYVFHDFVKNSVHYPLALIVLEILVMPRAWTEMATHFLLLMSGAALQAYVLGTRDYFKKPQFFLGNQIAPIICTLHFAATLGPAAAINSMHCQLFWIYSLSVGLFQELRWRATYDRIQHLLILAEHMTRVAMLMAPFWIYHAVNQHGIVSLRSLTHEPYYIYLLVALTLYGMLVGMANINEFRYETILRGTAEHLKQYSQWLLGPELLNRTVNDPTTLDLHRVERTVLFMDIRGFTRWSSETSPEVVVEVVNAFFQTAERVLLRRKSHKIELIGDEVMAVFATPRCALLAARELTEKIEPVLGPHGLSAGIGLHTGLLIEGVVGGLMLKKYSVLGDTVNTAKRICDVAGPGEILLSQNVNEQLHHVVPPILSRLVRVKGKSEQLAVYALPPPSPSDPEDTASDLDLVNVAPATVTALLD